MSVKALCIVMHANIPDIDTNALSVLIRLADLAHDNGTNARPAIETLALKTKLSVRTVQRALLVLEEERLIKRTREGRGRGLCASWAVNLALIETYRVHASKREIDEVPDFGDDAKRCTTVTFSHGEKVTDLHEKVTDLHEKVTVWHPTLLEPIKTLSARDASGPLQASQRRDARWPASNGKGPVPSGLARSLAKPSGNGSAMVAECEPLVAELAVVSPNDPGYEAWAGLVVAIVARRQSEEARAWLSRRNVCRVADHLIVVVNALTADKVREIFGALLAEQGWRVTVSGQGG